MSERDRTETVLLVVLWVVPLLGAAWLLAAAGLPVLAGVLLVVEAALATAVVVARRRPARSAGASRPWAVPAAMLLVLVGLLGITLVAVELG